MSIDDWRVERKVELRRHFCDLREILAGEDLVSASTAICRRLASWTLLQAARTVLTYLAFRNEIDLSPLFRILPHICWAVPRVEGMAMTIHPYDPTRLVRHRFGMLEPEPALPEIAPGEIDVVLVPGVAFDWRGGRMGFGGGYYDRFLPTTPAPRVGITYDSCLVDTLPCGEHDQRMDWIVTPDGLFPTERKGRS